MSEQRLIDKSEQRLIDANKVLQSAIPVRVECDDSEIFYAVPTGYIKGSPTIDPLRHGYVLSSVHEQVQWERDIAIDQIHSYGVEFGEKAEIQRVRHGKWLCEWDGRMGTTAVTCSVCKTSRELIGCYVGIHGEHLYDEDNYCPNCGARMDKE